MVNRKASPPAEERRLTPPPRKASHTRLLRVDPQAAVAGAPSTLPPPPFEHETAVVGLEWWLDAHMALASGLHWLEQLLETVPEGDAHADTVGRLATHIDAVRDALYELYCDAADERVASLVGPGCPLEAQVRGSYAWCNVVVGLLATVVGALRAEDGPDWALMKTEFRRTAALYPSERSALRQAVRDLPVDFTSPIEPLRNLPRDLEQLLASTEELHAILQTRFA
jgi:hypothetical protein